MCHRQLATPTVCDLTAPPVLRRVRNALPSAGPLFLTVLLTVFGESLALQYARMNYTTLRPLTPDTANTLVFHPDDSFWIRSRPSLDAYYAGISAWPHTFTDLFEVWLHAFDANPYTEWILSPSVYPPLVHLVGMPFAHVSWAWFLAGLLTLGIVGWFVILRRILVLTHCPWPTLGAVALEFFALPVPVALDRGNIEVLVALLLGVAVLPALAGGSSKTGRVWPIVLAAAFKISPVMLLGLVRWRRRSLVELVVSGFACAAASIVALTLMSGSVATTSRAFVDLLQSFGSSGSDPFAFRATLWGTELAYSTALVLNLTPHVPSGIVCLAIIAVFAFLAAVLPLHLWERVAIIGAAMVLFSADGPAYRLLYLLIAGAIFLGVAWHRRGWYMLVTGAILAATLAPKPWIVEVPWAWTLLNGTGLALIILLCLGAGVLRAARQRARWARYLPV